MKWRTIDIVIAPVLGAALGLIFWVWNSIGGAWYEAANAVTPGFGGIAVGIWLLGGVLGGLIIRKPGAAIFVEVFAACVSAAIGNQWGITTIYSGLAQGLGAELIFALFMYRRFGAGVAMLSGVGAASGAWLLEFFVFGNIAKTFAFNAMYYVSLAVSGAVLAGVVGFVVVKALASTGALDRFAAGRERTQLV
ncbi:MAG: ECF transporter S component [Corynebacterium sp.]|uniref:ECF transporter S component n=1 Tax=Corynebacterium sp. TaxID=1720 RepID=UPI0026DB9E16|nr:ECF transporter S component [Corynebacterium sp.]MDO4761329.1 ECF transporter S component [Corynebacterium sp.]